MKSKNPEKPKRWQVSDLVNYIRSPQKKNPVEKVAYAGYRNFITNTNRGQIAEMITLAEQSVHSKMPVAHWVFSWREDEQPSRQQVDELVDVFLEQMGLVGHQVVYGLHKNTQHFHLHIAVNRMNETTGKVVLPHNGFDIDAAHKVVAIIEHKQKWKPVANPRYVVLENGEVVRRKSVQRKPPTNDKAIQVEQWSGEKSATTIIREQGLPIIKSAQSWSELHEKLGAQGLRFEKKGSGAIIYAGATPVKASTIDRSISLSKLCKKLGEFVPGVYDSLPAISCEPVSDIDALGLSAEWQAYQSEKIRADTPPTKEVAQELATLKGKQRKERQIKLAPFKKLGLPVLNIARHYLKKLQLAERKKLAHQQRAFWKKAHRKMAFEEWLISRGKDEQAQLWRRRSKHHVQHISEEAQIVHDTPPVLPDEMVQFNQYANAVDADRYRVTCIRLFNNGDKRAFVLDKQNGESRGFTAEEMGQHMEEMIRLRRRGENIYYTPISEERHHILVDDMSEKSLTQFQRDGFEPAVILESSPGNYQCILTIPKLNSGHDKEVANRLAKELNQKYGDPKLSGGVHPHRAPAFENRKPKHQQPDGSFPKVVLHFAKKRQCRKALDMTIAINKEYVALQDKQRPFRLNHTQSSLGISTSTTAAYYAHFEDLKAHLAVEDYSRVDAMIAVRLRATGHDKASIAAALEQCAPTIREKPQGRNWHDYAERTANYAYGPSGEATMHQYEKQIAHWRKVEGQEDERPTGIRMK